LKRWVYAWASGSANHYRVAAQVGIGDRGEDAIFFMANVDELDLTVASQSIDDRIQRIADDAIAALDERT
jgi:elongation factor P hydroxylase